MSLFQAGQPRTGGRARGVRNKIAHAFLTDLLEEWSAGGREALRIARIEDPVRFSAMVASLLPKEMSIEVGPLQEISDDQLTAYLEHAERELEHRRRSIEGREDEKTGRGPAPLLLSVSQAK